ncbi:putative sigma54 specific transcriptional regulator [Desulfovibrio sp. X2]|nr:putative sigma54 specific transcriptional regulator [Desulfovibrio sp. X2]
MKVREIMQPSTHFLRGGATLRDAAALFGSSGVGGAQVLDGEGRPGTVFTCDDLILALARGARLSDPVLGHARRHICAVGPDTAVEDIPWQGSRFLGVMDGARMVGCLAADRVPDAHEAADGAAGDADGEADAGATPWPEALEHFPEPLFLCAADGTVRRGNRAARRILGEVLGEVLGELRGELPDGARPGAGLPTGLPVNLADALRRAGFSLERDPADPESSAHAARGETRYALLRWPVPAPDSARVGWNMIHLRDVSEQHAVLGKLQSMRELSREFRAIIDSSFDGIYITDGEGKTLLINRAYERITGIRAAEVVGRTMAELVSEGFYDKSVTLQVLQSRKVETIIQKVRRGKIIVVTGNPIMDEAGNIWRVVTNVRDVTELQRLQEELEKMSALHDRYRMELDTLRKSMGRDGGIVVRSKRMRDVYEQALRLAQVESTVLIMGESGVGKEVVAEAIHRHSPRRERPFVRISCAAIPEQLLESELFGYVQGAFTGASRAGKPGVFELAHQGTLFLDEIGELPLGLQCKLLRVLQERVVLRLGEVRPTPVDVRIMAASNRDLEAMMRVGQFRNDLYYRLNVVPIVVPPLRERREAVFDFIYRFLGRFNRKYGLGRQIDPEACDFLAAFDWPGNVRQLENTMERLVVLSQGDLITREDAQRALAPRRDANGAEDTDQSLRAAVERAERAAIGRALAAHGSTRAAARALGVNQSTIVRKARRYRLACD